MKTSVIIPAFNEEQSIGNVLDHIPAELVSQVVVVDNGSTDRTAAIAREKGAIVVEESRRGYGSACLRGMQELREPDIVVFLDGDFSDHPEEMAALIEPIRKNEADLVIGSRTLGKHDPGAFPPHAQFGNRLASFLIRWLFGFRYSDLGPFRAIRYRALQSLGMIDQTFGWTVEMQIKAIQKGLRIREVPVSYRKRIGKSKISGTVSGSVKAGTKIIWTILKYARAVPVLVLLLFLATFSHAQYVVEIQVVDLQVSVLDKKGDFVTELAPEDFQVWENGVAQQVIDLEQKREPFAIGVLIDTSSSMKSVFKIAERSTRDFLSSLLPNDEFFVMTFSDEIEILREFTKRSEANLEEIKHFRYGNRTKLYDAILQGVEQFSKSNNPRKALFLISDGLNTSGGSSLEEIIEFAQRNKVIVYSLILENSDADVYTLRKLSDNTGGTHFVLYENFPRVQAAYEKISTDLAHRLTLYYRSSSDYTSRKKPEIKVEMRNRDLSVRFQRAYFPSN